MLLPERLRIAPTLSLKSRQPIPAIDKGSAIVMSFDNCNVANDATVVPCPAPEAPNAEPFEIATRPAEIAVVPV